ncbi:hypothetical protein FB565_008743 [Actinoplanes lutulentus]|uniref:Uncharacterized protein n=1 Tax=Actinoplanes lutulentus TaxID=1287878 RepID=A0A327YXE3_9ACTN|nr:hypothetical protein [Actinoplanes lutulentus]MBB2948957.1 hypothetical protein [Actinoplanes lutulentus]RAK26260.1 hypothetical protein B0I29_128110 [Actinoplanes lutulentus]
MRVFVDDAAPLRFDDGSPVRAASAIAPFGDGWLVVQDDATHAAWWRPGSVTAVRVIDPVDGLDAFSEAAGTKHLKPDFESACPVTVNGEPAVLLLGSGSTTARMRSSLVTATGFTTADLTPVYQKVAATLDIPRSQLNLEGAGRTGDVLHWFQRGNAAAGVPSARADVDLPSLLAAATGTAAAAQVEVTGTRRYDLGTVGGVSLAITDAVPLTGGRILVSAAAEDTPNAVDDGPVVASALALLDNKNDSDSVLSIAEIPPGPDGPWKVEGLAIATETPGALTLRAVVDADNPIIPSTHLTLRVQW